LPEDESRKPEERVQGSEFKDYEHSSAPRGRQASAQCEALCWEYTSTLASNSTVVQSGDLVWGKTTVTERV